MSVQWMSLKSLVQLHTFDLSGKAEQVKQQSDEAGWECISVESSASERNESDAQSEHVTTDSSSDESEQSCEPPAPARLFHPPMPPDGCYFLQHSILPANDLGLWEHTLV